MNYLVMLIKHIHQYSSNLNIQHIVYDGGEFEQSINNNESEITSDYYEWPEDNGAYFYDILLEGG